MPDRPEEGQQRVACPLRFTLRTARVDVSRGSPTLRPSMQRNVGFGEQADKRHALRQEAMAEHPKHFGASRRRRLPQPLFQYGKIVQLGRFAVEQVEQAVGAERGWIHGRRGGEDDSGDGDRVEGDSDNATMVRRQKGGDGKDVAVANTRRRRCVQWHFADYGQPPKS